MYGRSIWAATLEGSFQNPSAMALTAIEFNECCSRFTDKYSHTLEALCSLEITRNGYTGWRWIPHSVRPDVFFRFEVTN